MLSKGKIKFIRSLQLRKYRQKYQKIVVEGAKVVTEALTEGTVAIQEICATHQWIETHEMAIRSRAVAVTEVTSGQMKQISSFKTPQDVLAVCQMPEESTIAKADTGNWILYLDDIRDPGNMGTILRIADWFGMCHICMSADTVDPFHPRVIQASMGSIFRIALHTIGLDEIRAISGSTVFATAMEGRSVFSLQPADRGILVLGNESHGISVRSQGLADRQIAIPNDYRLGADSLNVAVAAGIICAAIRYRQELVSP